MKLTATEYQQLLKAYREDRLRHPQKLTAAGILAGWGWGLPLERDFRNKLTALGMDWERKAGQHPLGRKNGQVGEEPVARHIASVHNFGTSPHKE